MTIKELRQKITDEVEKYKDFIITSDTIDEAREWYIQAMHELRGFRSIGLLTFNECIVFRDDLLETYDILLDEKL